MPSVPAFGLPVHHVCRPGWKTGHHQRCTDFEDHGDLKVIGNNTPRYHFGLDLNANYKGFDVRLFFQGVMKRDYWQGSNIFWGVGQWGMWWSTGLKEHEDYFRDEPVGLAVMRLPPMSIHTIASEI